MASQAEIRAKVTNQIVEALRQGVLPWRKPWSPLANTGFPMNAVSGRHYRGINPLLLQLAADERGYRSRYWATYRQWASLGGQVGKRPANVLAGEWGTRIILWKPVTKVEADDNGDEHERTFPLLREYTVFNAEQVDGEAVERFRVHPPTDTAAIDFGPAEEVIAATGADIRHVAGDRAAYAPPPLDYVQLPLKSQFDGPAAYYDSAFHELTHWSESRLGWTGSYALGELRAELGAAYLAAAVGVPQADGRSLENAAAYLDHWVGAMQADHRLIFQVSGAAGKACDFILSFSRGGQVQEQPEEPAAA
jgi:antirestriction protein ArdC